MTNDPHLSAAPLPAAPGPKSINCPACGAPITLRALGASVMVACPSCRSQIDISKPEIQIIQKFNQAAQRFELPLGARGALRGQTYEIVGGDGPLLRRLRMARVPALHSLLGLPLAGERSGSLQPRGNGQGRLGHQSRAAPASRYRDRALPKIRRPGTAGRGDSWSGSFTGGSRSAIRPQTTGLRSAPRDAFAGERPPTEATWTLLQYLDPDEVAERLQNFTRCPTQRHRPDTNPARRADAGLRPAVLWGALGLALLFKLRRCHLHAQGIHVVGTTCRPRITVRRPFRPVHLAAAVRSMRSPPTRPAQKQLGGAPLRSGQEGDGKELRNGAAIRILFGCRQRRGVERRLDERQHALACGARGRLRHSRRLLVGDLPGRARTGAHPRHADSRRRALAQFLARVHS